MNKHPVISLEKISKHYPGVDALKNVSFNLYQGEIRALVGENGAGKSTLIKMITGAEQPTKGRIIFEGKLIGSMSPAISEKLGIHCVYQNLELAQHVTVAENIWMGNLPSKGGFLRKSLLMEKTSHILDEIGYRDIINPRQIVGNLSLSQQGMVAIVKAISRKAKIIIFDEPTAILAEKEVKKFFQVIRLLKNRGLSVVYISHRLEEIFEITDSISILKDGELVGEREVEATSKDELIKLMVGRKLISNYFSANRKIGREVLRVSGVSNRNLRNCSFRLHRGEILGIYGLVGAGRTELCRAIFGADKITEGIIKINLNKIKILSPRDAIKNSLGLLPEDRRRHGLALPLSVKHNLNLTVYRNNNKFGFIDRKIEAQISGEYIKSLNIKTPTENQKVKNLSGGNQQKVVLGKWLAEKASIFILDEPTNGVDVGAKEEIYSLINKLAFEGGSIIYVSSYMPELIALCDRILVMRNSTVVHEFPREQFDEEKILTIAIQQLN